MMLQDAPPTGRRRLIGVAALVALSAVACSDGGAPPTEPTSTTASTTTSTTASTTTTTTAPAEGLLAPSDESIADVPGAARQRAVTLNLDLLYDGDGKPLASGDVTVALFPDVVYTAVITAVTDNGDGYTWTGYMDGVEISNFTVVTNATVFIANFASPEGVYEVSHVSGAVYRVIEVDQSDMQEHEG